MTVPTLGYSLALILCAISPSVLAQEPSLDAICALTYCRPAKTITVNIDPDSFKEIETGGTPIAYGTDINVYSGESVHVEAMMMDGEIKSLQLVDDVANPEITISIRFGPMEDGNFDSMLVIENPFDELLRYEAYISVPNQSDFVYTSSCPVGPKTSTYEHWPYAVFHLVMTNVRLLPVPTGDEYEITCE